MFSNQLWTILLYFYIWQNNVVYGSTLFCSSVHPLMGIWVVSTFLLWWAVMLRTLGPVSVWTAFSFLCGIYLGSVLYPQLGNCIIYYEEMPSCCIQDACFIFPQAKVRGSNSYASLVTCDFEFPWVWPMPCACIGWGSLWSNLHFHSNWCCVRPLHVLVEHLYVLLGILIHFKHLSSLVALY